jgi:hypothetical protein
MAIPCPPPGAAVQPTMVTDFRHLTGGLGEIPVRNGMTARASGPPPEAGQGPPTSERKRPSGTLSRRRASRDLTIGSAGPRSRAAVRPARLSVVSEQSRKVGRNARVARKFPLSWPDFHRRSQWKFTVSLTSAEAGIDGCGICLGSGITACFQEVWPSARYLGMSSNLNISVIQEKSSTRLSTEFVERFNQSPKERLTQHLRLARNAIPTYAKPARWFSRRSSAFSGSSVFLGPTRPPVTPRMNGSRLSCGLNVSLSLRSRPLSPEGHRRGDDGTKNSRRVGYLKSKRGCRPASKWPTARGLHQSAIPGKPARIGNA